MGKNQHVVPHEKGWAVQGEGNKRVTSVYSTQKEAISVAREIAKKQETKVVIHKKDGTLKA